MNWALIGASSIAGQYMINALRAQPGGFVQWVISGTARRASAFAASHGVPRFGTDLAAALADAAVDAVYVSSTNDQHFAQAMAAITAGKHVLCEKPLAMSVADATKMVNAADRAGVVFATNHHLRCSGSHQTIRDLIKLGRIGRVLSLRIHHAVHLPAALQGWRINSAAAGGGAQLA